MLAEALSFVHAIHAGNIDAAAVFADWLEERGDKRGVLLRRRWKRWQKDRQKLFDAAKAEEQRTREKWLRFVDELRRIGAECEASVSVTIAPGPEVADIKFRKYVQQQFPLHEYGYLVRP